MNTVVAGHGTLGLSSPWARAKVAEPVRSELAALIPEGWTVGVSVAPNNGRVRVWLNHGPDISVHVIEGFHAETLIRAAVAWAEAHS